MSILITGGLGYIGSHIASNLGKKAVIIDNGSNSNLDYKNRLPLANVYNLDLNYKNLCKIFSDHSIQGVIHLAGLKSVKESTKFPLKYYRNNIISSLELLECMDKFNIRKLIFSSSATVYGNSHKSPLKEALPLESTNAYASSKIIIEQMINDYADCNNKFKSISLRYFNPIGSNLEKGLCEQPLGKPQNIMPLLVRAAQQQKTFYIYGNNYKTKDGTCIRDYIHIKDLAEAHILALKKLNKIYGYHSINLGLGKGISVLELINIFEKKNNVKIKITFSKKRKGDVAISYANNKKAKKFLNWSPKYSYETMVHDSWRGFLANN